MMHERERCAELLARRGWHDVTNGYDCIESGLRSLLTEGATVWGNDDDGIVIIVDFDTEFDYLAYDPPIRSHAELVERLNQP